MHPAVFGLSSIAGAVLVTIALGSAPQPVAGGADLTVTHFDDPAPNGCTAGHCTLREAVIEANGNANADTIILNEGTYSLGTSPATDDPAEDSSLSGDLDISEGDLTIVGAGKNKTTIDAQQKDRAFEITAGEFSGITVELRSLTVANGRVDAPTVGAIANTFTTSHLKLTNSIVRDSEVFGNIAPCGGAIFNVGE